MIRHVQVGRRHRFLAPEAGFHGGVQRRRRQQGPLQRVRRPVVPEEGLNGMRKCLEQVRLSQGPT